MSRVFKCTRTRYLTRLEKIDKLTVTAKSSDLASDSVVTSSLEDSDPI